MSKVFKGSAAVGALMAATSAAAHDHDFPNLNYDANAPVPDGMSEVCSPSDLEYLQWQANDFVVDNQVQFQPKDDAAQGYMQAYAELHEGNNAFEAYKGYSERAFEHYKEFDNVAKQIERGMVSYDEVDQQILGRINELGHLEQFYINSIQAEKIAANFEMQYGEGSFARYAGMQVEVELGELNCDIEAER